VAARRKNEAKMTDLITHDMKHLLWKDEINDSFLLLKYGEIYKYSEAEVGIYCWNKTVSTRLAKKRLILRRSETDDEFDVLFAKVQNLPRIIAMLCIPSRRFNKGSKWIAHKERILGHRIIPFNPTLKDNLNVSKRPVTHSRQRVTLSL
jgi:hypothetical protein